LKPEFRAFLAEYGNSDPSKVFDPSAGGADMMLPFSESVDFRVTPCAEGGDLAALQVKLEAAKKEGGLVRKALNDAILQCNKAAPGNTDSSSS
jgi:hypothetical protein